MPTSSTEVMYYEIKKAWHCEPWAALIDLTEQKRLQAEMVAAYDRLRSLVLQMEHTKEEERKRIALELHDEFGQLLTGLKLDLSSLGKQLGKHAGNSAFVAKVEALGALVDDSIQLLCKVASYLRDDTLHS